MDKYEYKIRSQEIRDLIAQGEYSAAVEIADTIDWRRVKSVMMLCTISDLYKINRRLEEAKELLLLAYDRHPGGRTIVYSLCELSIKMGEFVQAIEYYKEFVQIAPKDSGRYVLQYKLYVAQEVSLEERIEVLEELKKRDYREKWAYELAYLYHRVGLATRCVEECDELILWFGEGKYVAKAMELKMLHQPLTEEQQARYEGRFDEYSMQQEAAQNVGAMPVDEDNPMDIMSAPTVEISNGEIEDIQVKTMDVGEYNTINLQKELADSLKELWEGAPQNQASEQPVTVSTEEYFSSETGELNVSEETAEQESIIESTQVYEVPTELLSAQSEESEEVEVVDLTATQKITQSIVAPLFQQTEDMTEIALPAEDEETFIPEEEAHADDTAAQVMAEMKTEILPTQELKRPEVFDKFIGMEYDGQMSFVVPETEHVEKQITGQLNIEDILAEWERMKKENEEKQAEEVRQRVLEHTGNILIDFDQAAKDGLLEKLESSDDVDIPELLGTETPVDSDDDMDADEEYGESEELEEIEEPVCEEVEEGEAELESEETIEDIDETEESDGLEEFEEELQEEFEIDGEAEEVELEIEPEAEELEVADEAEVVEEAETTGELEVVEEVEVIDDSEVVEKVETIEEEPEAVETVKDKEDETSELKAQESEVTESEDAEAPREEVEVDAPKVRDLTNEEKELYASFIQDRKSKEQLVNAIDSISLAPYTGNIVITGEEGMDTLTLAKNLMREVQMTDSNFSGKIAKISGSALNQRDIENVVDKLNNGALIIENAGKMKPETGELLHKALQQENRGIVVIMEGGKKSIGKLFDAVPALNDSFNAHVNIEALSNDSLVAFGKNYAKEQEYSIDEMGLLALHTCISDRQTSDHVVTILEVKEIVDNAIDHANRKTLGHFFDILFAKRYDEEDMIVLRENDFI